MNKRGFTLIELVMVIMIVGIASAVVCSMLLGVIDAWTFKFNRADLLWDGRAAVNRMVREIRMARDSASVITASGGQFRFIDAGNKDIAYSLSAANLNRAENGSANLLAENVSSLAFSYYDAGGNPIPTPVVSPTTDIRRVRINLTLTKNGENVYLQSESVPRNFQ